MLPFILDITGILVAGLSLVIGMLGFGSAMIALRRIEADRRNVARCLEASAKLHRAAERRRAARWN